jgi:sulfur relay (sulfurtransferase) DsrF/TusC family protein
MDYTVCVVIRHPPYGSVLPAEGFRTIQALQTFERDVTVLFMDDGVITMMDGTDPDGIGMHSLSHAFVDLLALPGVTLAVHTPSMDDRGYSKDDLVELPADVEPYRFVELREIEEYISGHKAVMCF